jgi:hypothetical protein
LHRPGLCNGKEELKEVLEELSDHVMDIVMNSVRANAKNIKVSVAADRAKDLLTISIVDDGKGMTEETLQKVLDPFYSTKIGKKVGLGVPLLKGATEVCNGRFRIKSVPCEGTEIEASFPLSHPDVPPLGNMKETMFLLAVSNPDVRFCFKCDVDGREFMLDTGEVAEALGGVPINHPEVIAFLKRYVEEQS